MATGRREDLRPLYYCLHSGPQVKRAVTPQFQHKGGQIQCAAESMVLAAPQCTAKHTLKTLETSHVALMSCLR